LLSGSEAIRAAVLSVSESYIALCVPERARDGEANRAVVELTAAEKFFQA
jgi:hypothetical protein